MSETFVGNFVDPVVLIYGYLHLSTVIYTSHPARHWPPLRAASNLAEKRLQALKGAECRPMAAKKFPELVPLRPRRV